jgi:hypothetical protein
LQGFQRMHVAAIQIKPIAAGQINSRVRSLKHDMPFKAMQHDVACNMVRRNFSARSYDKPHGFEMLRLDECGRFGATQLWAERSEVNDFSRLRVILRHVKPTFRSATAAAAPRNKISVARSRFAL